MALFYIETSALVKLYVREPGTDRILALMSRNQGHRFAVLTISGVEFHSAIRRREREGDIDPPQARRLLKRFSEHMETKYVRQSINDSLLDVAANLVDRYPLRAYDAVQLAGWLIVRSHSGKDYPTFVTSDHRLIDAAGTEGIPFLDPSAS